MTDRGDDMGSREELCFEELIAQSSVGGVTDPVLDNVCTEEEAATFAAEYSRGQALLKESVHTRDASSNEAISKENSSEIRRVETLRDVWPELAAYVRNHLCDDRNVVAEIMHEAAADFTQYWREKGELDRKQAISVLRRAAKLRAVRGGYRIRFLPESVGALLDLD